MKMTYKKIIILISIFIAGAFVFSNYSYASEELKMNNAPRKYFKVDTKKLADVKVTIKDNNGISSVKLYGGESWNDESLTKDPIQSNDKINEKEYTFKLSHKNLLKGKEKYFYIEIKDGSGNIQNSRFRVYVKKGKYAIDDAPRVKGFSISGNKMSFIVRDAGGSKYAKILDLNNNNKQIKYFTKLKKGDAPVEIDISKCKEKDGQYKLKIITEDRYKVSASRTISFRLKPIEVTQVKLDKDNLSMDINEVKQLKATIKPNNATNMDIKWTSSDENVAKVDNKGKVKAIATGTAIITAKTNNEKEATCNVTVSEKVIETVEATKIQLDSEKFTIYKGETKQLKATIEPKNVTNKTVTWSSSNTKVATVDKNGKIKAIAAGTATITAKTDNEKKDTCKVKVKIKNDNSAQKWLQTCEKVAKNLEKKNFRYYKSGASNSYKQAIKSKNYKCDCATYVSWCLQEYGILKEGQRFYSSGNQIKYSNKSKVKANIEKYAKIITVNKRVKDYYKNLQPGDICCYTDHVNVYVGNTSGIKLKWHDAGPAGTEKDGEGGKFTHIDNVLRGGKYGKSVNKKGESKKITYIIRIDFSKVK